MVLMMPSPVNPPQGVDSRQRFSPKMEDSDLFAADADPSSEECSKKRKEEEEKWLDTSKLKKQCIHPSFLKLHRQVLQRRQRGPDANEGKSKPTVLPGDIPPRILQMMNRPEHVGHSSSANKANYLKPILWSLDYYKPSLQKMNPPEEEEKAEESAGTSTLENSRFVWTLERHIKFLQVMHQFGLDDAPISDVNMRGDAEKILEVMKNVPGLTITDVVWHLERYNSEWLSRSQTIMWHC